MALHDDPILQQPDRLVLHPNLPCENLPNDRLLLVLFNPNLVPVAVRCAKGIEGDAPLRSMRHAVHVVGGQRGLVVGKTRHRSAVAELFPRPQRSVMGAVDDDAQTFVRRNGNVEADEEEREHKQAPPTGLVRHDEEYREDDAHDNVGDAGIDDEKHTRFVSITDGPADEIRVRLTAESGFDHVFDKGKCRRVGGVL